MSIFINKELRDLVPPLSEEEYAQLEANIVAEGIRDPLVVWKQPDGREMLIDGHNRWNIAAHHSGLTFEVVYKEFADLDEAKAWIYKNQLGRRNLDKWQRYDLAKGLQSLEAKKAKERQGTRTDIVPTLAPSNAGKTRDKMAEMVGVSHGTYDKMKVIDEKGTDALKQAVRSGEMSINHGFLVASGKESKSPRQLNKEFIEEVKQEREDFQKKKDDAVVSFSDIQRDKENAKIVAREVYGKCLSVLNSIGSVYIQFKEGEIDLAGMSQNIDDAKRELLKESIAVGIKDLQEIFKEVDI